MKTKLLQWNCDIEMKNLLIAKYNKANILRKMVPAIEKGIMPILLENWTVNGYIWKLILDYEFYVILHVILVIY